MDSDSLETRAASGATADSRTVRGTAAVFNQETVIAGAFRERIARGAFGESLRQDDPLALLNHEYGRLLGRKSSGTLRLREDSKGLQIEVDLPDSPDGQTALELIRRKDLKGMSFGFRVLRESWEDTGTLPLRTLEELELVEVSIVSLPAYPTTTIGLRSLASHRSAAATRARMRMDLDARLRGLG